MEVKDIKMRVWSLIGILRNSPLSIQDYDVILLLLSLYKDGFISKALLEKSNDGEDFFSLINNKTIQYPYGEIIPLLSGSLRNISPYKFKDLCHVLLDIDKEIFNNHFPEIFDNTLYYLANVMGKAGNSYVQPLEISRFMCNLFEMQNEAKVYNPFAGLASFRLFLNKEYHFFGQEINSRSWAIGVLRLLAHDKFNDTLFENQDSILKWPINRKFDLILSNPPFNLRMRGNSSDLNYKVVEPWLIEKGLDSLSDNGKMTITLPHGFLFKGGKQGELRKKLVEDDLIDTIISLPAGLLMVTGIPFVIMTFDKNKKSKGQIRFIDATGFVKSDNAKIQVLDDVALTQVVNGQVSNKDVVKIVDLQQIRDNDFNLNVPRYFKKEIDTKGIKLGDILEHNNGRRNSIPQLGAFVRIRDLKESVFNYELSSEDVEVKKLPTTGVRRIDFSCLLVATRWKSLKPTWFKFDKDPVYISNDIAALTLDEEKVSAAYLIQELNADYITEQVNSFRYGVTIVSVRVNDLLTGIIIKELPTLKEQKAKITGIFELTDKIKQLQKERNALAHGKTSKKYSELASLKHTLGTPRQNILDWTDNMLDFFKENLEEVKLINTSFEEDYNLGIVDVLENIKQNINFISEVLEKGEHGFFVDDYDEKIISLRELNRYIDELSKASSYNFKIQSQLLNTEDTRGVGVKGNFSLFQTLVNNILENANKYGFNDFAAQNLVVFELKIVADVLSLEIKNNGNSFPKGIDQEKFIREYVTSDKTRGTGYGGYHIHQIATKFGDPNWKLRLNEDILYPVKFEFKFPLYEVE